jgi:hypothetical protein
MELTVCGDQYAFLCNGERQVQTVVDASTEFDGEIESAGKEDCRWMNVKRDRAEGGEDLICFVARDLSATHLLPRMFPNSGNAETATCVHQLWL